MLAGGKLIATFGSQGGRAATVVQQVASVATGQTPVDSPGTAAAIAGRIASRADFGHLGPVERAGIDRVIAPDGIIGSEGWPPGPPAARRRPAPSAGRRAHGRGWWAR